mmetsp:Transcript_13502/g.42031  ORF Transcript_13502/g.42031 Transcript_13502/m.42031 type:complete len:300 (-) Transcript_13502:87-986(-)
MDSDAMAARAMRSDWRWRWNPSTHSTKAAKTYAATATPDHRNASCCSRSSRTSASATASGTSSGALAWTARDVAHDDVVFAAAGPASGVTVNDSTVASTSAMQLVAKHVARRLVRVACAVVALQRTIVGVSCCWRRDASVVAAVVCTCTSNSSKPTPAKRTRPRRFAPVVALATTSDDAFATTVVATGHDAGFAPMHVVSGSKADTPSVLNTKLIVGWFRFSRRKLINARVARVNKAPWYAVSAAESNDVNVNGTALCVALNGRSELADTDTARLPAVRASSNAAKTMTPDGRGSTAMY